MHATSLQSCLTLCNSVDYSLLGFSVHGISQARILEWVTIPFSRESCQPRNQTCVFCSSRTAGRFLTAEPSGKPIPHISSVQFSRSVVSHCLLPHELQHARPSCPSPTSGVQSDSHPSSRWCHPAISSTVVPFSFCPPNLSQLVLV